MEHGWFDRVNTKLGMTAVLLCTGIVRRMSRGYQTQHSEGAQAWKWTFHGTLETALLPKMVTGCVVYVAGVAARSRHKTK